MPAARTYPPGPRLPKVAQALRYTYDFPRFWEESRKRYGHTWTLRLPGFPPGIVTTNRDAIRRLLTGDPLAKRHGNDLLRPLLGPSSIMLLEPREHLARRKLELGPFHGDRVRSYDDARAGPHGRRGRELAAGERRRGASARAGPDHDDHPRARPRRARSRPARPPARHLRRAHQSADEPRDLPRRAHRPAARGGTCRPARSGGTSTAWTRCCTRRSRRPGRIPRWRSARTCSPCSSPPATRTATA